jgi:hypothetical protein
MRPPLIAITSRNNVLSVVKTHRCGNLDNAERAELGKHKAKLCYAVGIANSAQFEQIFSLMAEMIDAG